MEQIREYLLQIVSAALLCGIAISILGKKGMLGTTIKLLAGIFMAMTLVSPWLSLRLDALPFLTDEYMADASGVVSSGEISARDALRTIIKQRTEAYILDKADSLGATISADVSLSDDSMPVPNGARLTGSISPYAKSVLSAFLSDDLGIGLEDQIWIQ